ncbi:MAG: hypothetical protein PHP25_01485, partial [Candidatus Moranbacteria bacterium]|nr:hypothetical protein [Candidatus Moranbacteria bacterium]
MRENSKVREANLKGFQDVHFDRGCGLYIGKKRTDLFVIDIQTGRATSDGYKRIYREDPNLLVGEIGNSKYILDPNPFDCKKLSEGFQKISKLDNLIIGERNGSKYIFDPLSRRVLGEGYDDLFLLDHLIVGELEGYKYILDLN